jgi:hypothetical protein
MKRLSKVSIVAAVTTALSGTAVVLALQAHAATTRYEAESAPATCGGVVASNHSGYSGIGFCDTTNAVGSAVQFTINSAAAGTATVGVRYANGTTANRPSDVSVNGAVVQSGFAFEPTGAWNAWATKSLTAQVAAGTNTVRLAATTSNGLGNIDFLEAVTPDGGGDGLIIVRGTTQGLNAPLAVDNIRPEFVMRNGPPNRSGPTVPRPVVSPR